MAGQMIVEVVPKAILAGQSNAIQLQPIGSDSLRWRTLAWRFTEQQSRVALRTRRIFHLN